MVASVGKRLQQARINKQLSVEEAARVTRIRPDKLIDLEEDNYANFPSMSYAKGFLVLYARFLGVDVRDFADSLHTPNPVSTEDYEYLNAGASAAPPPTSRRPYHFAPRRERTVLPVIVFGVLIVAIGLAVYLFVSFQRIGPLDEVGEKKDASSPSSSPAISTLPPALAAIPAPAAATQAPALRSTAPALVAASPVPVPAPAAASPTVAGQTPSPVPASAFDPSREVRRAEPVLPTSPQAASSPGASPLSSIVPAAPDTIKRISIRPVRKTWVTIRKDVAGSTPFFQDWLYPGDAPLKLVGHKFWITIKDPTAVQITRDGQPFPANQSDIEIE